MKSVIWNRKQHTRPCPQPSPPALCITGLYTHASSGLKSLPTDNRQQHPHQKFLNTELSTLPAKMCSHCLLKNHHRKGSEIPDNLHSWEDTRMLGSRQNHVSYPHTPSFLFPLFSKSSVLSITSASPIPVSSFLSRSEGPAAFSPVGPAGLDCTGSLGFADSPCSCQRE